MRWSPGGSNPDVEDRRGTSYGGGGGGMRIPVGRFGIGGFLVLLVLSLVFKRDFLGLLGGGDTVTTAEQPVNASPAEQKREQFVEFILGDVQSTWDTLLASQTRTPYQHAKLVLFRDAVESACGFAQAATGPFYCPADHKVYIDLGFYDELAQRFGAPGEFAEAYVLAHEIGHHVQYLLGTTERAQSAEQRDPRGANAVSVRVELQADCYAGVWGAAAAKKNELDPGEAEEGLAAAAAVGDDRIQRMGGRAVNPDAFTHGSAEQRATWFRRGFQTGQVSACNTFNNQ
ncbi:MAG TPA: neutral zinc metallopeptidase [Gemmatimonadaceae bacterium]|nr:neutral zinc metallopeptidase [Gemmatimonadaceae bacterium]